MSRGLFLGKFLPPHDGHLFVCDVARRTVDHLIVFVCSYDAEPIDGYLRAAWMRECVDGPGCTVVHMHRDIPQGPEDHPEFWQIWKDAIFEHHPEPIDVVFGSETYIHKLAEVVGATPFVVDLQRTSVPVSASAIRADPAANWKFIPPPVRTHYQKKVTLIGPESTGKSTLAVHLSAQFNTKAIPEYGRAYDAEFRQGSGWRVDDLLTIARRHAAATAAIARRAGPLVVEDTDILQTIVWSEALLGEAPCALVDLLMATDQPDLYLLLSPDVAWMDDGTRYHAKQEQRTWFHERLQHWLTETGAKWHPVTGSNWTERVQEAQCATQRLLD